MASSIPGKRLLGAVSLGQRLYAENASGDPNLRKFPLPASSDPVQQLLPAPASVPPLAEELAELLQGGLKRPAPSSEDDKDEAARAARADEAFETYARRILAEGISPKGIEDPVRVAPELAAELPERFVDDGRWNSSVEVPPYDPGMLDWGPHVEEKPEPKLPQQDELDFSIDGCAWDVFPLGALAAEPVPPNKKSRRKPAKEDLRCWLCLDIKERRKALNVTGRNAPDFRSGPSHCVRCRDRESVKQFLAVLASAGAEVEALASLSDDRPVASRSPASCDQPQFPAPESEEERERLRNTLKDLLEGSLKSGKREFLSIGDSPCLPRPPIDVRRAERCAAKRQVSTAFLQALQKAKEDLERLAAEVERAPRPEPRGPKDFGTLLVARPEAWPEVAPTARRRLDVDALAEAMEAWPTAPFRSPASEAYDHSVRELKPSQLCSIYVDGSANMRSPYSKHRGMQVEDLPATLGRSGRWGPAVGSVANPARLPQRPLTVPVGQCAPQPPAQPGGSRAVCSVAPPVLPKGPAGSPPASRGRLSPLSPQGGDQTPLSPQGSQSPTIFGRLFGRLLKGKTRGRRLQKQEDAPGFGMGKLTDGTKPADEAADPSPARGAAEPEPELSPAKAAAAPEPADGVYLAEASRAYDMSLDFGLYSKIAHGLPQVSQTCGKDRLIWRIFHQFPDSLGLLMQDAAQADERDGSKAGSKAGGAGRATPEPGAGAAAEKKEDEPVCGVRLRDLQDLVAAHRSWFEEARWCRFSQKDRRKTMYDVCPELIIPATTCSERIVTLLAEDMEWLGPKIPQKGLPWDKAGIFHSASDLSLTSMDPKATSVRLGGQDIPLNMTVHGKLVPGGAVRRNYWAKGAGRSSMWKTVEANGREMESLAEAAPIPEHLLSAGPEIGEHGDRVWAATELKEGDTIVLRRGVSYIEMVSKGGKGFPLDSFASHFWGEETLDFVATLENHAKTMHSGPDPSDRTYYVCTFNNNQHRVELGSSWEVSPFNRALHYVAGRAQVEKDAVHDAVMIFDEAAAPLQRKWCVFEAWRCTELDLPLHLFCPHGEINRKTADSNPTTKEVLRAVQDIDLETAACSVKADAVMINRAIEDSPGGFAGVHAKLRTRVLDLTSFIGTLAVSIDPATGKKVKEIELSVRGCAPKKVQGQMMMMKDIAKEMCTEGLGQLARNVLLIGKAGAGKSVFSRTLVRYAVKVSHEREKSDQRLLPVRVPLSELTRVIREEKLSTRNELRLLDRAFQQGGYNKMSKEEYANRKKTIEANLQDNLSKVFDKWAERTFLRDAAHVLHDEGQQRLLILDGFDEAAELRAEVINWLRKYLQSHPTLMTMMLTRPSGVVGKAMSSGVVRDPKRAVVQHVDHETSQVALSDASSFPAGAFVSVSGLDPPECCVLGIESRLSLTQVRNEIEGQEVRVLKVSDNFGLDNALAMVPGIYRNIELLQFDAKDDLKQRLNPGGPGKGAVVDVQVLSQREAGDRIKEKQNKNELSDRYSMRPADVIEVRVTRAGEGYALDTEVKIRRNNIPMEQIPDVKKRLAKAQELIEEIRSAGKRGEEPQRDYELDQEVNHLRPLLDRLERIARAQDDELDIVLKVQHTTTYVTLTRKLGSDDDIIRLGPEDISKGAEVKEVLVREQLVKELGFCDFEIDTVGRSEAAQIIRNTSGLPDFQDEFLSRFPNSLWDRPLMATLLSQYLKEEGLEKASSLSHSVAELGIYRFIASNLIRQAAAVMAPKPQMAEGIYSKLRHSLETTSRDKMNKGVRSWNSTDLRLTRVRGLWEEAIRGHLRLFEPQEGGAVQFYHFTIQELLAAEYLSKRNEALETASRVMVTKQGMVQTGLAPLRFLVQAKLVVQNDPHALTLDYQDKVYQITKASSSLVTHLHHYMPKSLESLVLRLPQLTETPVVDADKLGGALPPNLRTLELNLYRCKVSQEGLNQLGVHLKSMTSLRSFTVNIKNCADVDAGSLVDLAKGLPADLEELDLQAYTTRGGAATGLDAFAGNLPPGLRRLALDLSGWALTDAHMKMFGQKVPRSIEDFELVVQRCRFTSAGVLEFCRGLPPSLRRLSLNFRLSLAVSTGGLVGAGDLLPKELAVLHIVCNRYIGDEDLKGISSDLPPALEELHLDFRRDTFVTDIGLRALGAQLSGEILRRLELRFPLCMRFTDGGVCGLTEALPETLEVLLLDFAICRQVGDKSLVHMGSRLPPKLKALTLLMYSCRGIGDAGLRGVSSRLPQTLKSLQIDVSACMGVSDEGLRGLGSGLPDGLEMLDLSCRRCKRVNDNGFQTLGSELPRGLQTLRLHFHGCVGLTDHSMFALATGMSDSLRTVDLDFSECTKITDQGLDALTPHLPKVGEGELAVRLHFEYCLGIGSDTLQKCCSAVLGLSFELFRQRHTKGVTVPAVYQVDMISRMISVSAASGGEKSA